jgi:hypothetical protein
MSKHEESVKAKIDARCAADGEVIPWAENPLAKRAAKDADGKVAMYETDTVYRSTDKLIDHQWFVRDRTAKWKYVDAHIPGPWQDSLRRRPEGL